MSTNKKIALKNLLNFIFKPYQENVFEQKEYIFYAF
ncbi:Uncharacterised protein [Providencia rettgeri]|nr:Uncharacterised protein [Providencia rettgeri]